MTTLHWRRWTRALAATHLGQAAVLLVPPVGALSRITGADGVPPVWIVRVLGARLLAQAAPEAIAPSRNVLRIGVIIDLTHAASMLAAAQIWPRYRRAALASAGSAGASALAGVLIGRGRR